jgi:hypothetical protein
MNVILSESYMFHYLTATYIFFGVLLQSRSRWQLKITQLHLNEQFNF